MDNINIIETRCHLQCLKPTPGWCIDSDKQTIGRIVDQLVPVHDRTNTIVIGAEAEITDTISLIPRLGESRKLKGIRVS